MTFQDSGKDDSCVVVTTRNGKLAEYCSPPSHIHRPEFLGEEEATTLFLKKTNKSHEVLEKDENTKGIVENILKKCGGLPLAILTIGGLLANKVTEEWESLYKQLPWDLATNPSLDALRQVVSLSYNHLPSHLKPCFLHLSIFPEDFEIEKKHLVNRWVAEGLVADDTVTRTLEEVAESYFFELISWCMFQPSKLDDLEHVKTCRIHDIVHDIAVSISRQENYVFILGEQTSNMATRVGIRHLSCIATRKLNTGMDLSQVRSFTLFCNHPPEPLSLLCSSKFKMLRILDLKTSIFTVWQQDIKNIGMLLQLNYLHFPTAGSCVYSIPRFIGNLQGLETFDIQNSLVSTLPTEITKLQKLRSLRCSRSRYYNYNYFRKRQYSEWFSDSLALINLGDLISRKEATADLHMVLSSCWSESSSGIKLPKGVGSLKQLQILEKVDIKRTSRKAIKELGELTQLSKLVVVGRGASKQKDKAFCEAAQKLSSLLSLDVDNTNEWEEAEALDMFVSFASALPSLERLKLKGLLRGIPAWVGESVNLAKIDLQHCRLKELEALAELPNLIRLRLHESAYDAEKLVFCKDAFPKLRILLLLSQFNVALREVTFERSTSPKMETICIDNCTLISGINGIKHLPKVNKILILRSTLGKQDMLKEEVDKHTNHPVLQMQSCDYPAIPEETEVKVEVTGFISEQGDSSTS